jgi:hypothetical protein
MNEKAPVPKLDEYEQPVIYAPRGSNVPSVWHVPRVVDERVEPLCGHGFQNPRVTSVSLFRRRAQTKMCEVCSRLASTNEYPESAPDTR